MKKTTTTKLLAIIMAVALLTGVISFMTFAADTTTPLGYSASRVVKKDTTGIANIKDFDSSSVKTEYVVSDLEGLNKLAALVTDGKTTLEGVTVYQTAHISGKGLGTDGANATFAGIGKDATKIFAGTYDGQGYYINDLVISGGVPNGIFRTACGTIRNVVIGDGVVSKGTNKCAALIGEVRGKDNAPVVVDNCYIAATIEATGSLSGGVIGQADQNGTEKTGKLVVKNVTFNGSATVTSGRAGGILGRAAAIAFEMDNCVVAGTLLTGTVETPKASAEADGTGLKKVSAFGGFVGETTRAATEISIKNSVNVANITSGCSAAAFVGSLPKNSGATIVNCTNYGTITNTVASGGNIKVGGNDYAIEYHSALVGFVKNEGVTLTIGDDSKNLVGQTAPAFEKVSFKPAVVVVGGYSAAAVVKKDTTGLPNIKDYDDTNKKTEYVINDMEGLQTLAYHVTNSGVTFEGITIYQTAHIIGGGVEDAASTFAGIGKDSAKIFSGTYDGQGYVIDNFLVNSTAPSGLFRTANGTIRNVVLGDKLLVKGTNKVGALIGEVRTKTGTTVLVENCYVAATVEGSGKLTGGVIGQIDWDTTKGETPSKVIMKNITFNGKMTSTGGRSGGLLGRAAECDLEIDRCVVAGTLLAGSVDAPAKTVVINKEKENSLDLKQVSSCAGFVGETTRGADRILIKDSVNLATVTSGYAGVAFLGSLPANAGATIENCYNFGTVTSTVASGSPIKVADKDASDNAIERDFLMKYHSTLVGYIYNTNANLVIDANSADKAGEKAPDFEKVDFSTVKPPVQETTPEATTPAETTAADTTAADTTAADTTAADTTAKDTTAAETTVKTPEETTGTNAGTTDKKGCGSVVGGTIALIVSVACGAMLIARKKED